MRPPACPEPAPVEPPDLHCFVVHFVDIALLSLAQYHHRWRDVRPWPTPEPEENASWPRPKP